MSGVRCHEHIVEPSHKRYLAVPDPVTVHTGDTLKSICQELADAYGDTRDWREITYYTQKENNKWGAILPGDKLIVPLEVPAENALGRQ